MGQDAYPWYRHGKRAWYVWHEAKQVRLHADKEEAFRLWHALLAGERSLVGVGAGGPTVGELAARYLADLKRRVRPVTFKTKGWAADQLVREHGHEPALGFDAQAYLNGHPEWGRSTRWFVAGILKAIYALGLRDGLLSVNPLRDWAVPGPQSKGEVRASSEDILRFIQESPGGYREALAFLYLTGCRPGEMARLEASHVNLAAGCVVYRQHKTDRVSRPRVIHLTPSALVIVQTQILLYPTGHLFRNQFGDSIDLTTFGRYVWRFRERYGLGSGFTLYSMRHAFATDALASGVPDAVVSALLGHTSTAMLHKHYNHLSGRTQVLKEALGKVRGEKDGC